MIGKELSLVMITDPKLLVNVLTTKKYASKARLMVDISAVRRAYNTRIINNIAHI